MIQTTAVYQNGLLRPAEPLQLAEGQTVQVIIQATPPLPPPPRRAGNCQGLLTILSDDSDHLEDFREIMG